MLDKTHFSTSTPTRVFTQMDRDRFTQNFKYLKTKHSYHLVDPSP